MSPKLPPALEVLSFLQDWFAIYPYAPTLAEIADRMNYGYPSSVSRHINTLVSWRLVERIPGKARGIWLTEEGQNYFVGPMPG